MHKRIRFFLIGCLFFSMVVSVAEAVRLRKDQATLSATEQTAFVNALHSMKTTASSNPSVSPGCGPWNRTEQRRFAHGSHWGTLP